MSAIEFMPNWIYTVLLVPLGMLFHKVFSIKNDVEVNKAEIKNIKETLNGLGETLEKTCDTVQSLNINLEKLNTTMEMIKRG